MKYFKSSLIAILLIVTLTLIPVLSGCHENQITPDDVNQLAVDANSVSQTTDELQLIAKQVFEELQKSGAISSKKAADANHLSAEIDKVQVVFDNMTKALKNSSAGLTEDNIRNVLTIASQLNDASAPVNPYYFYVKIGITILLILLPTLTAIWKGISASKAKADAQTKTVALNEIVTGLEKFKKAADQNSVAMFKQNQQQSPETKAIVSQIAATA
jgi:hypothetical protein